MYYLIDGLSPHADEYLTPSIFYLINWSEHTERLHLKMVVVGVPVKLGSNGV